MNSPIVFAGPSASAADVLQRLPDAEIMPPIGRGDLYRARERGGQVLVIIDGMFAHQLAVSPREVVDVARDGAIIIGASSMGALRAADCWPAGVIGVGLIYRLYRIGFLDSDDEVAIATDGKEGAYRALSLALVNVRVALSRARRAGLIERVAAERLLEVARTIYFPQRSWRWIFQEAGYSHLDERVRRFLESVDVKRSDAHAALQRTAEVVRSREAGPRLASRNRLVLTQQDRYPGHDRLLGLEPAAARRELCVWLFGSGRYQKYVWPLVVGEPELTNVEASAEERPAAMREGLATVLARVLADVDPLAARLWAELDFVDELDAELLRWQAVRTGTDRAAAAGISLSVAERRRAYEEVAIAHGVRNSAMLRECVEDGRLFGAIPFEWVERAISQIAAARTAYASGTLFPASSVERRSREAAE